MSRDGHTLTMLSPAFVDGDLARVVLPLVNLASGTYVVRIDASIGDDRATQQMAFTVSQ